MDEYRVYRTFLKIMVPCAIEKKYVRKDQTKEEVEECFDEKAKRRNCLPRGNGG